MASRRNQLDDQLDLFSNDRPTYETIDSIRTDGRETLARASSPNGEETGSQRPTANHAGRGGGKDEGRNGHTADAIHPAGVDSSIGARSRVGNGAGTIHPAPGGSGNEPVVLNQNIYRFPSADGVGAGTPKEKWRANLAAI